LAGIFGTRSGAIRALTIFAVVCVGVVLVAAGVAKADQMVASWYGPGFEGATTASGEPFDPNDYTAAHKTLEFGTKLIVTYNGSSVVVRVNDRGPYVQGRDLDLSQAAAEYIGLTAVGEAAVEVSYADPSTPTGPYDGGGQAEEPSGSGQQEQQAPTQEQTGAGQKSPSASEDQYAAKDQYAAGDQYEKEDAKPAAAAQYGNQDGGQAQVAAGPPPVPEPERLEAAPVELATPGSTVERRIQLAEAAAPTGYQAPEPEPQPAPEPEAEPRKSDVATAFGITELPDTGGLPLGLLAGGLLVAAGSLTALRKLRG
jgi:rare lipoprotein A